MYQTEEDPRNSNEMQADDTKHLASLRPLRLLQSVAKMNIVILIQDQRGCNAPGSPRAWLRHQFASWMATQPCYQIYVSPTYYRVQHAVVYMLRSGFR
jgi:hypothetical protein